MECSCFVCVSFWNAVVLFASLSKRSLWLMCEFPLPGSHSFVRSFVHSAVLLFCFISLENKNTIHTHTHTRSSAFDSDRQTDRHTDRQRRTEMKRSNWIRGASEQARLILLPSDVIITRKIEKRDRQRSIPFHSPRAVSRIHTIYIPGEEKKQRKLEWDAKLWLYYDATHSLCAERKMYVPTYLRTRTSTTQPIFFPCRRVAVGRLQIESNTSASQKNLDGN